MRAATWCFVNHFVIMESFSFRSALLIAGFNLIALFTIHNRVNKFGLSCDRFGSASSRRFITYIRITLAPLYNSNSLYNCNTYIQPVVPPSGEQVLHLALYCRHMIASNNSSKEFYWLCLFFNRLQSFPAKTTFPLFWDTIFGLSCDTFGINLGLSVN